MGERPVTGGRHLFQSAPHLFRPDQRFWVAGTGMGLERGLSSKAFVQNGKLHVKVITTVNNYLPKPAEYTEEERRIESLAGWQ